MRLRAGSAIACFMTLLCLTAGAQEPPPPVPGPAPVPLTPQPVPVVPADLRPEEVNAPGWVSGQIILGQQLGIRGQATVAQANHWTFVAEGFYGALGTKFGGSEAAGGGGRALLRRTSSDGHNSLLLGPGVNLLYQFDDGGLPVLAPSVDLSWLHGFGGGGGWEIGINAGFGVSLADQERGRDVKAGQVTPIISVFTGFRF